MRRNRSQRVEGENFGGFSFFLLLELNLFTRRYNNKDFLWGVRLEGAGATFTEYFKHSHIVGMSYNLCRSQK